jgi:serine/threonine-protein kinase HipA
LGGARPKALIEDGHRKFIAKFSSSSDTFNVVRAEFVGMKLAGACGLDMADVQLRKALGKDVLLVERFDRTPAGRGKWYRRPVVSALTLLELHEMIARFASYEDLAERVRHTFDHPTSQLHELFRRIVFNLLIGNTDDHARNHAAFVGPEGRTLTPAYDVCPQRRSGGEASQGMLISGQNRSSRIQTVLEAAPRFLLDRAEGIRICRDLLRDLNCNWEAIATQAGLSQVDRAYLWRGPLLNPYCFEELGDDAADLASTADAIRERVA